MGRTRAGNKGGGDGASDRVFTEKKSKYFVHTHQLLDECDKALVMGCNNVMSQQMQNIRIALRGSATVLMGKNTMVKKVLLDRAQAPGATARDKMMHEMMTPLLVGNVGLVLTNSDLKTVKDIVDLNKVQAPARQGAISPVDVTVPAGNTGLEPTKTSFFQALNIGTKITKGTVEILKDERVVSVGDKVGSSEATLLAMLNIKPFFYGMICLGVYDQGSVYGPEILDITSELMTAKMTAGISRVTGLSLGTGFTTKASFPHVMMNSFKNLLALSLGIDYSFEKHNGAELKEAILSGKSIGGGGGGGGGESAAPAKAAAKVEEEEEEEDDEMGFGLFD